MEAKKEPRAGYYLCRGITATRKVERIRTKAVAFVDEDGNPGVRDEPETVLEDEHDRCGLEVQNGENCPKCVTFHRPESRVAREAHARAAHRRAALAAGLPDPAAIPPTLDVLVPAPPAILAEHPGAMVTKKIDQRREHERARAALELHEDGSVADHLRRDLAGLSREEQDQEDERLAVDHCAACDEPKEAHVRDADVRREAAALEARTKLLLADRAEKRARLVAKVADSIAAEPARTLELAREHGVDVVRDAIKAIEAGGDPKGR